MSANHFSHMLSHHLLAVVARRRQSWHQLRRSAGPLQHGETMTWRANHLLSLSNMTVSLLSVNLCCCNAPLHPVITDPSASSFHRLISTTRSGLHGGIYLDADRGSRPPITNLPGESKRQRHWDFTISYHLLTINMTLSSSNWPLPD